MVTTKVDPSSEVPFLTKNRRDEHEPNQSNRKRSRKGIPFRSPFF